MDWTRAAWTRAIPRWALWGAGALVVVIALAYTVAFLIEEPLRRHIERGVNESLKGYSVRIRALDFHPLGFALDLKDSTIVQDAHPDPPVAEIPTFSASVQWRSLLFGRLVGDIVIDRPRLHINLKQARKEISDEAPIGERGWQKALEAIYPLKINEFRVVDGDITYIDRGQFKPLHLHALNLRAGNIRNIGSPDRTYPSDIHLEGIVFEAGKLVVDGHANFLGEPHAGVLANVTLERVDLDYFKPITTRYNVLVDKGTLSATGAVEYAPRIKVVKLHQAVIEGVRVDYIHTAETAAVEKQTARKAARVAKEVSDDPGVLLRIDRLSIVKSTFGFVNKATRPQYRLFVTDTDLTLTNLSNHRAEGTAVAKMTGTFMGSGSTTANATFRPEERRPDFDLDVRIQNTKMPAMNDLFRAYGNFDVVAGSFSFFSELSIRNGAITGYVKPLFKDMDVYDKRQDRDKNLFRKMYEGLVGGIAKLLENRPRDEVATKVDISGDVDDPEFSSADVIIRLIQNAFFKAILPGFEREIGRPRRSEGARSAG